MGRKKDPFWEHVEQSENKRFRCIYCRHDFAGSISITRIKYHLSGIRNHDTEICPKVPEDVQEKAFQAMEVSNKKAKSVVCSKNAEEIEIIPTSLTSSSRGLQQASTSMVRNKDKNEVDEKLAKFVMLSNIEVDVIQRPFFVDFLKSIAEFGPSYELPKSVTLQLEMIPKIEEKVVKYTENIKASTISTGYTVTFEIWCEDEDDDEEDSYVNVFVYTLEGAMLIGSFELSVVGMKRHTFVENVCSIINSFRPRKVVQFIMSDYFLSDVFWCLDFYSDGDDSESAKPIADMLIEKYPLAYATGCVSDEIQSLLSIIYYLVPWVRKTMHLAYVIVKYLHKHSTDLSFEKEKLRSKDYGNDYFNKIASEFLMLMSILKVERELQALQLSIASPSCEQKDQALTREVTKVVDKAIHAKEFWTRGKEVVQLLQPLFRVLQLVDGNGPTSGYLYEAMRRAEHAILQNCGRNQVHYEMIGKLFKKGRSRIIHPIHAAAAFLNPAYMLSQNFSVDNEMEEGINYISKNLIPAESKEFFMKEVQLYRTKDPKLFTATSLRLLETCHPGIWWKDFGGDLYMLKRYARQILSQPCSSSLCKMDYLKPEVIDHDHKLRINLMMMEKFSLLGKQELEPINLDKIIGQPEYAPENFATEIYGMWVEHWPSEDYWGLLTIDDPILYSYLSSF